MDICAPGVQDLFSHLRHAAMIEDEGYLGTPADETNSKRQLTCQDAKIKGKTVASQAIHILDECFALSQIIGLCVQNSADPFQFRMTQYSFQVSLELVALRAATGHNTFKGIVSAVRKPKHIIGLVNHKRLVNIGHKMNRLFDSEAFGRIAIVLHVKGSIQNGQI